MHPFHGPWPSFNPYGTLYQNQWLHPTLAYRLPPQQGWRSGLSHASSVRPNDNKLTEWKDYGGQPFVVDIEHAAEWNPYYRTALWTGNHLQVTLMSIPVGGDIGLEQHADVDQFIRIEQGNGLVQMGGSQDRLDFVRTVSDDDAIMIPAGTWHNITNVGDVPLKLYSIYAPPEHPFGTVHRTKAEAQHSHP